MNSYLVIPVGAQRKAMVDTCDEWLTEYRWYLSGNRYARHDKLGMMHRAIMVPSSGQFIDHINGDGLDNRRENLRFCTRNQNQWNQHTKRPGRSKYRGVYWDKNANKWGAQLYYFRRKLYLGLHETEESAAEAYNECAIALFGEFASPNDFTQPSNGE